MKTWLTYKLLTSLSMLVARLAGAQSGFDIEGYHYIGNESGYIWVPVIHIYGKNNFYSEVRYNYEETGAVSTYLGKTYASANENINLTPAAGLVVGKNVGLSLALNSSFTKKNVTLSSQSQYTISTVYRENNFFYNWSDLYYDALPWLYTGFAFQHTILSRGYSKTEKGVFVGFRRKRWTFPLYFFNNLNGEKYFVIGINADWKN